MKTTTVIVELLVSGVLVVASLLFLIFSFFPNEIKRGVVQLTLHWQEFTASQVVLAIVFISICYALGTLFEVIGMLLFEPLLQKIKKERLRAYLEANEPLLSKSPLLMFVLANAKDKKVPFVSHGEMRFYVLMQNASLYGDIDSQISRFRLVRVLFVVEFLFGIGILALLSRSASALIAFGLLFDVLLIIVTIRAIHIRFHRYCRSIERSYKMLMLERLSDEGYRPTPRTADAAAPRANVGGISD